MYNRSNCRGGRIRLTAGRSLVVVLISALAVLTRRRRSKDKVARKRHWGGTTGDMNAFQKERLGWLNYGSSPAASGASSFSVKAAENGGTAGTKQRRADRRAVAGLPIATGF